MMRSFVIWMLAMLLVSCSAHSTFKPVSITDTTIMSEKRFEPHTNAIFITKETLPPDSYEMVAQIEVGKVWYGSSRSVFKSLADRARELGADAVIEVKTWHQPSGWSWAAPHGSGTAVKIKGNPREELATLVAGEWH